MLYVSTDSPFCSQKFGASGVVIKDTNDDAYSLELGCDPVILDRLRDLNIMPQTIAGFYHDWRSVHLYPITSVELKVFDLLENPYFFVSDKMHSEGAGKIKSFGIYNMCLSSGGFMDEGKCMSIAKLLMETCGTEFDRGAYQVDTTRNYIAVCVDDQKYQSVYLRFDIKDYSKLQMMYAKYSILKSGLSQVQVCDITVPD